MTASPQELAVVQNPHGRVAEAYRVLRNSLDYINFEDDIKTLLVTSAEPFVGKSTVAANLSVVLSQAGRKVVFVNCDFRCPDSRRFFGIEPGVGLSEVLTRGGEGVWEALQRPERLPNLWVMHEGNIPPNPSELLGSATMDKVIASMRDLVDLIIFDSPPLLAVADAAVVARWADGVLMVTRQGVTTRPAAERSRKMLEGMGARIVGVVVSGGEISGQSAYGYYGQSLDGA